MTASTFVFIGLELDIKNTFNKWFFYKNKKYFSYYFVKILYDVCVY